MMELEYSFEQTPWEAFLSTRQAGDTVFAGKMLALLEGEGGDALEDALQSLEEGGMNLSVADLPRPTITGEAGLRLRREEELVKAGLSPRKLEEGDPLRLYLEDLAGLPACGDERLLAERCAAGDESAGGGIDGHLTGEEEQIARLDGLGVGAQGGGGVGGGNGLFHKR